MKKILVSFVMVLLVAVMSYSIMYGVFANDGGNFNISDHESSSTDKDEFTKATITLTGVILAAVRYTGAGIAVISLVLIGAKYLYASPGEKADYKKNLIVYTIGGVGMFSVGTILDIIQKFSEKVGGSTAGEGGEG